MIKQILNKLLNNKTLIQQLKENGLKVGQNFFMNTGCMIDFSHCWLIEIGDNVTLGPNVTILAHDASTKFHTGYTRIAPVTIGNNVFIGVSSVVMPGVTIGNNVVIGAGSVVTKDILDDSLVVGSPAKVIGKTSDYILRQKALMRDDLLFDESFTLRGGISEEKKQKMKTILGENGQGFVS
jgi:maltose O-acetyltransferase